MKRRVLRAHANKRNLRLISAVNTIVPGSYNVLCDASFLRAVLLAYDQDCVAHDRCNAGTSALKTSSPLGRGRMDCGSSCAHSQGKHSIMSFLRKCVDEAFGVLDGKHGSAGEAKRKSRYHTADCSYPSASHHNVQVRFYCLPATVGTLRRLVERHGSSMGKKDDSVHGKPKALNSSHAAHTGAARYVNKLLSELEILQPQQASTIEGRAGTVAADALACNEIKAIEKFVQQCYNTCAVMTDARDGEANTDTKNRCTSWCAPSYKRPNSSFFFVATQSHDVRKRLPARTALLRLAFKPTCVWIELLDRAFNYHNDGTGTDKQQADTSSVAARCLHELSTTSSRPVLQLPIADVAFMNYICRSVQEKKGACMSRVVSSDTAARDNVQLNPSLAVSPASKSVNDASKRILSPGVGAKRNRNKEHNPNPLSFKKKQKREVFRVDDARPK